MPARGSGPARERTCCSPIERHVRRCVKACPSHRRVRLSGREACPEARLYRTVRSTLRDRAPSGNEWVYEIKIDGYRTQLHIENGRVTLYTRTGLNWTDQYSVLASAAKKLGVKSAIIDGEAAVIGDNGVPDFQALRRELSDPDSERLQFFAFDLLYLNGYDLRGCKLLERKTALRQVLLKRPARVLLHRYLEEEDGNTVFRHACGMHLEGIVYKNATRLPFWPHRKLDQGEVRQERDVSDCRFRRQAGRKTAQDRFTYIGKIWMRRSCSTRQSAKRVTKALPASCAKNSIR